MRLKEVFEKSVQFFKDKKIETARLDAEILIAHVLKVDRLQIYLRYEQPLAEAEIEACRAVIRRRAQGEPVAYIVEEKGFYGEDFYVGPGVLIPRPESELIVEEALEFIKIYKIENPKILDLGAGTGCLGFSILKNCLTATLSSFEKSIEAHKYLLKNLSSLKLQDRVQVFCEDINLFNFSNLEQFDIIIANPPYIDIEDTAVEKNVKLYEPHEALFAPDQGMYFLKNWLDRTKHLLNSPGLVLFEMGYRQGPEFKQFAEGLRFFSEVQIIKDLSGLDRTLKCTRLNHKQ